MKRFDLIVAGGGAAGFFGAINAATFQPGLSALILEKGNQFLSKVRISGGGRCNVTHACFDPKELTSFYPRGHKELLGPFHSFQPGDIFQWFAERGVELKVEDDNRAFPVTDNSGTIIDCFMKEAGRLGIQSQLQSGITALEQTGYGWRVTTNRDTYECASILITTGSSGQFWDLLSGLGIKMRPAVPSLFTFNIRHQLINDLPGVVINPASVAIQGTSLEDSGPLLITHWGLSGPAILKLSAWGAEWMHGKKYRFEININFLPHYHQDEIQDLLKGLRTNSPKKSCGSFAPFELPNRFWTNILLTAGVDPSANWADLSNAKLDAIAGLLCHCKLRVDGKSTFKDEFVTCGGIDLKEVDMRTMQSRHLPNMYFAGEVLNIDAVTGGFNFQAAWTTAWIAAKAITQGYRRH